MSADQDTFYDQSIWEPIDYYEGVDFLRSRINGTLVVIADFPDGPPGFSHVRSVEAGSRHEPADGKGIAHIGEHGFFKRTKRYWGPRSIWLNNVARGGSANATTDNDQTKFEFSGDGAQIYRALDYENDRRTSFVITDEDLRLERPVVRNEMEGGETDNMQVVMETVEKATFEDMNYHHSTIGNKGHVEAATARMLNDFIERMHTLDRMAWIFVGRIPSKKLLMQQCTDLFGRELLDRTIPPQSINTLEPPQTGLKRRTVRREGDSYIIAVSYKVNGANHPDAEALGYLGQVLSNSKASFLNRALIEKTQLCSSVMSFPMLYKNAGIITTIATIPADRIEKTNNRFFISDDTGMFCVQDTDTLKGIEREIQAQDSEEEIEFLKKQHPGCTIVASYTSLVENIIRQAYAAVANPDPKVYESMIIGLEGFKKSDLHALENLPDNYLELAQEIATSFVYGDATKPFFRAELIKAVTPKRIHEVAAKYCKSSNTVVATLIPEDISASAVELETSDRVPRNYPGFDDVRERARKAWYERSYNSRNAKGQAALSMNERALLPVTDPKRSSFEVVNFDDLPVTGSMNTLYKVHTIEKHLGVVSFVMRSGGLYENTDNEKKRARRQLLAILAAGMMSRGAGKLSAAEMEEFQKAKKVSVSIMPQVFTTHISVVADPDFVDDGLKLLLDELTSPTWPEDQFELIKQKLRVSQKSRSFDMHSLLEESVNNGLYTTNHPAYEISAKALLKALDKITLKDVKKFWREQYQPFFTDVVVAGNFPTTESDINTRVKGMLRRWYIAYLKSKGTILKNGDILATPLQAKEPQFSLSFRRKDTLPERAYDAQKPVTIIVPPGNQANATVIWARRIGTFHDGEIPRNDAELMAASFIGSGFMSKLMQVVRDTYGLTYGTYMETHSHAEMMGEQDFRISATFNPAVVAEGIRKVRLVVQSVFEQGIPEAERYPNGYFEWLDRDPYFVDRDEVEAAIYVLEFVKASPARSASDITTELEADALYQLESKSELRDLPTEDLIARFKKDMRLYNDDAVGFAIQNMILDSRSPLGKLKRRSIMAMLSHHCRLSVADGVMDGIYKRKERPIAYVEDRVNEVHRVTTEDVNAVIKKYMDITGPEWTQTVVTSLPSSRPNAKVDGVAVTETDDQRREAIQAAGRFNPTKDDIAAMEAEYERTHGPESFGDTAVPIDGHAKYVGADPHVTYHGLKCNRTTVHGLVKGV